MLLNALFYCVLSASIALSVATATLVMAHAATLRTAQRYVRVGYERAAASLEQALSGRAAAGAPYPLPTFTPIPAACADSAVPCMFEVGESIALTQTSTPQPEPSCDAAQNGCAVNEERNGVVVENRMTARIVVTISTGTGDPLLTRSFEEVLRITATPPYVSLGGARDGTFDAFAANAIAGDDGGQAPVTPSPCASSSPGVASDTEIRVAYVDAANGTCTDGSTWSTASYSAQSGGARGWRP